MPFTPKAILQASWLLPSFFSAFFLGSTVQAATIANWHYDSDRHQQLPNLKQLTLAQPSILPTVTNSNLFAGVVPYIHP